MSTGKILNKIKIDSPAIILVEPQLGENIGFSARAMLNFDINNLRIVNPREGWPNKKAISTSAGAIDSKKSEINIYNTLEDATEDISYLLATTARKRDLNKPVISPEEASENLLHAQMKGASTGIMFGGEKSGLKNSDLVKADEIINIKSDSEFSSINLAMSVMIISYQWYVKKMNFINKNKLIKTTIKQDNYASKKELNFFVSRLISLLSCGDFFTPVEKKESMINNIEAIFTRSNLTSQELRTLHGIISSLIKN